LIKGRFNQRVMCSRRIKMAPNKCPDCGSQSFYVKDPEDQYNISGFELKDGGIISTDVETDPVPLEVADETEIFCDRCAWHDKLKTVKKGK
jgi:hypothetical protein